MDSHHDRGGRRETLGHVDIHAQLRRASIEVIDLGDGLAAPQSQESSKAGYFGLKMHFDLG